MNKFNFIFNEPIKLSTTPYDLISNYIDFDINSLLSNKLALIFGGCLRDIVSKEFESKPFNDIDIATFNPSCTEIMNTLLNAGYSTNYSSIDTNNLYFSHFINEPITLTKNDKKIQLIRPRLKLQQQPSLSTLILFIRNVDLSCCGLAYDTSNNSIKEIIHGSYLQCQNKQFHKTNGFLFNPQRSEKRALKLTERGWTKIKEPPCNEQTVNDVNLLRTF